MRNPSGMTSALLTTFLTGGAASLLPSATPPPTTLLTSIIPRVLDLRNASPMPGVPANRYCYNGINTHKMAQGETCDSISKTAKISVDDFKYINPSLNSKCSNLVVGRTYCLAVPPAPKKKPAPATPKQTLLPPGFGCQGV